MRPINSLERFTDSTESEGALVERKFPLQGLCRACVFLGDRALDQIAKFGALLLHPIFGVDVLD